MKPINPELTCPQCGKEFISKNGNYYKHIKSCRVGLTVDDLTCNKCNRVFKNKAYYNKHILKCNYVSSSHKNIKNFIRTFDNIPQDELIKLFIPSSLEYYSSDEIFLINYFRIFNPSYITFTPLELRKLIRIFEDINYPREKLNKKIPYIHKYIILKLYNYIKAQIKHKTI